MVLVAAGAALALLNGSTRSPLGALRLLGRRAHHVGDLLIIVVLALSPLLALRHLHLVGLVVAEVVALVLLRVERTTRYRDPAPAPTASAPTGGLSGPPGTAAAPRPVGSRRLALSQARRLGYVAGVTRRVVREGAARRREAAAGGAARLASRERQ